MLSQISNDSNPDLQYLPPLEVHWLWHVHMLSPAHYASDCQRIFSRTLNHQPCSKTKMERRRGRAEIHWNKFYPDDPFTLPRDKLQIMTLYRSILKQGRPSKLSYNVIAAAARQKSFYYQDSLPHFKEGWFIKESVSRYSKFLRLKSLHPDAFLVPCYDIDLIWHTHKVHPVSYAEDSKRFLGRMLPHDDTDPDRSEGSKLDTSFSMTKHLWTTAYGTEYSIPGNAVSLFKPQPNSFNAPRYSILACITIPLLTKVSSEIGDNIQSKILQFKLINTLNVLRKAQAGN